RRVARAPAGACSAGSADAPEADRGTDQFHARRGHPPLPICDFGDVGPVYQWVSLSTSGGVPNGIRTRVLALKGPRPGPLDDGDVQGRPRIITRAFEPQRAERLPCARDA